MFASVASAANRPFSFLKFILAIGFLAAAFFTGFKNLVQDSQTRLRYPPARSVPNELEGLASIIRREELTAPVLLVTDDSSTSPMWRVLLTPLHVRTVSLRDYTRAYIDLMRKYPKS